ncbi:MAG: hypothetical protein B6244_07950 [Candidatus Cloacimonetes bacterium 4572_55]|nr:MAG: hypothetical protein B6244_07950 [Candidatus Cloacimonetes bacterium 4572_55]
MLYTSDTSRQIENIANLLADELNPERIILFGSYAWGVPAKDSDLDLLVIVPESDLKPTRRAIKAHRCLIGIPVAVDILVRTKAEVERAKTIPSSLIKKIVEKGKIIF